MSLLSLGIKVLAIVGLGMAPLVDQSLPIPGYGEMPQGTGTAAREFILVSALYGDGQNGRHLQAQRSDIIDAFKPDLTTVDQPLILRYQAVDDEGDVMGDCLDIICKYRSGLEGNWDNHQQERIALQFKMYMPYIQATYGSGVALGYQTTVANANYILKRGTDGTWAAMLTGTNGTIYSIVPSANGNIYIGGFFTNLTDANGDYISSWNGTAFSSLGTGMNSTVRGMAIKANQNLYAVGDFSSAGGVANTRGVAFWNGAIWAPLGLGLTGVTDNSSAIAISYNGKIYIGTNSATIGGVANTSRIGYFDGVSWNPLGTGMDTGSVVALAFDLTGHKLYAAGPFNTSGGVTTNGIAVWDELLSTWSTVGTGAYVDIKALVMTQDGTLYAGGDFTTIKGVSANYVAKWNGVKWLPLGSGVNGIVWTMATNSAGELVIGGDFTTAGGNTLPDHVAKWTGSSWLPFDVDLPGAATISAISYDKPGNLYLGFNTSGNAISATVISSTIGSSKNYPKIVFTGSGALTQLKNYTTGKSIFFNLTLLDQEIAVLDLNPNHISFTSSWRGNILNTIIKGSNLDFFLAPGANNISTYYSSGTGAGSAIVMTWNEQYWSLDGATLK